MPNSVFDLGGELTIDTTQVKTISDQVREELSKVDQQQGTAKVTVDDGQARSAIKAVDSDVKDLGKEVEKPRKLNLDASQAKSQMKDWRDSLKTEIFDPLDQQIEQTQAKLDAMPAKAGGLSRYLTGAPGMMVGGTMMTAGITGAVALGGMAVKSAYATDLMQKSTEQVFGTAAETYIAEAEKMAEATGFMTTQILASQIAMNKATVQTGLKPGETVQPLAALAGDLAASSGLPQYAGNIEAVTNAISAGLRGTTGALLDFGIQLDDLYALSLPVNAGFKALGDAITPAQMAQARYNAMMVQAADVTGAAAKRGDDMTASMREFSQKMEGAKEAVGEALIPVANTLADFVAKIPKPLLEAGIWAGIGAAIATAIGGAIIGLNALVVAIRSLGRQATATAVETAAGGGGKGLLGNLLGGAKGLLGKLGKGATVAGEAAGGAAAATGGASAAGWMPTVGAAGFDAAAGGGAGMTAAAGEVAAAAGGISAAALALPAAMAAGTAAAILVINKGTDKAREQETSSEERRTALMQERTAKLTGMGDAGDPLQADYVAAKWGRDYKTGELISFNKYMQRLGDSAQEWQRQQHAGDQSLGKVQTTVTLIDRTSAGVQASSLDSGAYEQTVR